MKAPDKNDRTQKLLILGRCRHGVQSSRLKKKHTDETDAADDPKWAKTHKRGSSPQMTQSKRSQIAVSQ